LVQNTIVSFTRIAQGDFISLTDIAKVKNPDEPKDVVKNWLRSRSTLDFLGLWGKINNPSFKGVEFDSFKNQAGTYGNLRVTKDSISISLMHDRLANQLCRYFSTNAAIKIASWDLSRWLIPAAALRPPPPGKSPHSSSAPVLLFNGALTLT
jgi:hypothetical protein